MSFKIHCNTKSGNPVPYFFIRRWPSSGWCIEFRRRLSGLKRKLLFTSMSSSWNRYRVAGLIFFIGLFGRKFNRPGCLIQIKWRVHAWCRRRWFFDALPLQVKAGGRAAVKSYSKVSVICGRQPCDSLAGVDWYFDPGVLTSHRDKLIPF